MKQDKALRKTLSYKESQLPFGFNERVMEKIYLEVEYKNKRNYNLGIVLASIVSFLLFGGALYLMHLYFNFNVLELFSGFNRQTQYGLPITYYLYMSFMVLILLGLDYKFRQVMTKDQ